MLKPELNQPEFPTTSVQPSRNLGRKYVYAATVLLGLISLLMIGYTYSNGNRLVSVHRHLCEQVREIRFDIMTIHLRFEEMLVGDRTIQMDSITSRYDQAKTALNSMIAFSSPSDSAEVGIDNPELHAELMLLDKDLDEFWAAVESRLDRWSESIAGSNADIAFDAVSDRIMDRSDKVKSMIENLAQRKEIRLAYTLVLLSFMLIVTIVAAVFAQSRFYRSQNVALRRLAEAYATLQEEMQLREEATRALRESEVNYETLAALAPVGVFRTDAEGRCKYVNKIWSELTGLDLQTAVTEGWLSVVRADDRNRVRSVWQECVSHADSLRLQFRIDRKSAGTGWVQASINPEVDAENKKVGFVGTFTDISSLKKVEAELRDSERRFRNLFDKAPVGYLSLDKDGRLLEVNHKWLEIMGYSRTEAIGEQLGDFMTPESQKKLLSRFVAFRKSGEVHEAQFDMVRKDSSILRVELAGKISNDRHGVFKKTHCVMFDITERAIAEQALKTSEERYRSLTDDVLDSSEVGMFILDADLKVVWINNALETLFGLKRCDVIGHDKRELIHGEIASIFENPELFEKKVLATYESNSYVEQFECHVLARQGRDERWLHHWSQPIRSGLYAGGRIEYYTDITERKKAELDLAANEELVRAALQSTADGILIVDSSGRVVITNNKFAELWRIPTDVLADKDDDRLLEYVLDQLVDPDQFIHKVKELYGTDRENFDTLYFKDGRVFERYSAPMIMGGAIAGRVWSFRDVTARRKAEEGLRQSNQRLQLHVQQTPLAFMEWDTGLKITDWNPAAEEIFGYTREEALNRQANEIIVPDEEWPQVTRAWQKMLEYPEGTHTTNRNVTKDGREIVCEWYNTPLVDDNDQVIAIASLVQDVTERYEADEEIRKFKTIADEAPYGVAIADLDGTLLYVNNAFAQMHGYRPDDLVGEQFSILHTEEQMPFARSVVQDLKRNGSVSSIEVPHVHKDGHAFPILLSAVVVTGDSGQQRFLAATATDITDLKQLQSFAERAKRLETAGRIAGQVAHDFNNLLGPLTAYPELIRDELDEGHSALELVDGIEAAAKQIAEINQQLLTLGRRGHYNMSPLNMNDAIQRVIKQIGPMPDSIAMDLKLAPDLMNISGGMSQISRALVNVLNNAVDAMSGKGRLSIKTENWYSDGLTGAYKQIPVGEYAKVTICDSGCGIPEKSQLKIFEPFFTTKTADKKRGSGLGLSVVHAVVNDHGGCIDIESAIGLGTKVYLYFPITRENVISPETEDIAGGSEKILVVDDDQIQREVNQRLLQKLGYDVHVVSSGEQALEFLRHQTADLLILDMIMPGGIDGTQTFLRAREINPDQKAIIVSGYAEGDRVRDARLLGAGAFLKKPITLTNLARAVRTELDVAIPVPGAVKR